MNSAAKLKAIGTGIYTTEDRRFLATKHRRYVGRVGGRSRYETFYTATDARVPVAERRNVAMGESLADLEKKLGKILARELEDYRASLVSAVEKWDTERTEKFSS